MEQPFPFLKDEMIRIRAAQSLLVFLVAFLPPFDARAAESAAMPQPHRAQTYQEAIQEAEQEQKLRDERESTDSGWRMSGYLGLVALLAAIGLMFWASRWTRRLFFRQAPGREMRVIDRMAIGKNSTLLLVQMRDRVYWIADHPGGVAKLDDWPATADSPNPPGTHVIPPDKEP